MRDSIIRCFRTHKRPHKHTHTLKRFGSCYPPTPPLPEHSLHHLLFSFNKTPLHYPITSKTISSSFIFFSSIPPSPSYLIVPPARSPLWKILLYILHSAISSSHLSFHYLALKANPPPPLPAFSAASFVHNSVYFFTGSNRRKMICLT